MVDDVDDDSRVSMAKGATIVDPDDPDSTVKITEQSSALLTNKQREYLLGVSDIEPKSAEDRAMRARIRNRVLAGVRDMRLLLYQLEDRDCGDAVWNKPTFEGVRSDAIGFLLRLFPDEELREFDRKEDIFEIELASALRSYYRRNGIEVEDIDVSIDVEFGREAEEVKTEDLGDLSEREIFFLMDSGELDLGELVEYAKSVEEDQE